MKVRGTLKSLSQDRIADGLGKWRRLVPQKRQSTYPTIMEIKCVLTRAEGVESVHREHFDLYLLDNWMPNMSGRELTEKLRAFDVKTPILFYSGAGYESDKEAAFAAGAQGYLVKPVVAEDLIAEVARLITQAEKDTVLRKSSSVCC